MNHTQQEQAIGGAVFTQARVLREDEEILAAARDRARELIVAELVDQVAGPMLAEQEEAAYAALRRAEARVPELEAGQSEADALSLEIYQRKHAWLGGLGHAPETAHERDGLRERNVELQRAQMELNAAAQNTSTARLAVEACLARLAAVQAARDMLGTEAPELRRILASLLPSAGVTVIPVVETIDDPDTDRPGIFRRLLRR
jgi:hypothetical protein